MNIQTDVYSLSFMMLIHFAGGRVIQIQTEAEWTAKHAEIANSSAVRRCFPT